MTPTALITGGQQGIGLGVALALQEAGFSLVLAAERPEDDPSVLDALRQLPGARYLPHDLRDIAAVPALLDAAGPFTTLVSNAGVPAKIRGDLLELAPDSFDFVMDVNLRGAFFLAQAAARRLIDLPPEPYRSITFITSVSAELVSIERGEYCMSKAAASMMARLFAARLAPHGIGVFEIRPGIVETPMTAGVRDRYDGLISGGLVPAGRWGRPADIGSAVRALALGELAFATGAALPLDGGLSIPRL